MRHVDDGLGPPRQAFETATHAGERDALRRGAENGSELGAWSASLNPIKEDSLARKVEEYLPFGLAPMFIRET